MVVFLNGRFVTEEQAVVSVFDRGFLYGDGLFETLRVVERVPFRWELHLERLQRGAQALKIALPFSSVALREFADRLLKENKMEEALLRLTISRGVGIRGYSINGADRPSVVMTLFAAPPLALASQWRLASSSIRLLAGDPLAQLKSCNKMLHILARAEAEDAGADEALLVNSDGFVAEGASSNCFWIERDAVCTAPLLSGVLGGVTRSVVLELCQSLGLIHRETNLTLDEIFNTDGVFLSLSSLGIVEATALDGRPLNQSPTTGRIRLAYVDLVRKETGRKSTDTVP